jgi:hypothetical protein
MRPLLLGALCLVLPACGLADGGGDDDGSNVDGGMSCQVQLSVTPVAAVAPTVLVVDASLLGGGALFTEVTWELYDPDDQPIEPLTITSGGSHIEIDAPAPGVYTIIAHAPDCADGVVDKTVTAPGAQRLVVRLRYTPPPGALLPPQDDPTPVTVYGGADSAAGTRQLDPGSPITGTVTGPSGALGAELRLSPAGGRAQLVYAGADGAYSARIVNATHDVTVVPYDYSLAPARYPDQGLAALDTGFTLDAGDEVTGVVVGPGNAPVANAWVAVATGDLPPALAKTAADGSFTAHARGALGPLRVSVVPPGGTGLARLDAGEDAGLAPAGGPLELRLPDVAVADVSLAVKTSGGAPLPGARVTFVASSLGGGSVVQGGMSHAAVAGARVTVTADGAGAASAALPYASYVVVVEPPENAPAGEGVAVSALDLSTGPPGGTVGLASAASPIVTVKVVGPDGLPVAGARVSARGRGVMGVATELAAQGDTDDVQGAVGLPLTGAMAWEIVVEPPATMALARTSATLPAGAGGGTTTVTLAKAVRLSGKVEAPGSGGVPGVRVAAHCVVCAPGQDPAVPLAETASSVGGVFELRLPDPGVAP